MTEEFGETAVPDRAWKPAVVSILARIAAQHHLVVALPGAESLFTPFPLLLRAGIVAPEPRRIGNVMLDQRVDRPAARELLLGQDTAAGRLRRARFGRSRAQPDAFDIILNAEHMDASQMAEILGAAVAARALTEQGLLSTAAEA